MKEYGKEYSKTYLANMTAEEHEHWKEMKRGRYKRNPEPQKTRSKKYYQAHPAVARKSELKLNYGLTPEQWEGLFTSQGRKCASCGSDHPGNRNWNVDHDHATTFIRGILCNSCNMALGTLKDSLHRVQALAAYLQRTPDFQFEVL
jgi:hypothetical protein